MRPSNAFDFSLRILKLGGQDFRDDRRSVAKRTAILAAIVAYGTFVQVFVDYDGGIQMWLHGFHNFANHLMVNERSTVRRHDFTTFVPVRFRFRFDRTEPGGDKKRNRFRARVLANRPLPGAGEAARKRPQACRRRHPLLPRRDSERDGHHVRQPVVHRDAAGLFQPAPIRRFAVFPTDIRLGLVRFLVPRFYLDGLFIVVLRSRGVLLLPGRHAAEGVRGIGRRG